MKLMLFLYLLLIGPPNSIAALGHNSDINFSNYCFEELCIDSNYSNPIKPIKILAKFGTVEPQIGYPDDSESPSYLCYTQPKKQVWLRFTQIPAPPSLLKKNKYSPYIINEIMLSTVPICKKSDISLITFMPKFGKLSLGMSKKEVINLMGEPHRIDDSIERAKSLQYEKYMRNTAYDLKFGHVVFVYEVADEGLSSIWVYFINDKVTSILQGAWQS